ncbi:MAG TPA: hypothetical protein VJA46_06530 [Acidimicrobiia bacterium]|nr:hypothetical protein [Acidimicrobiia bacterium]
MSHLSPQAISGFFVLMAGLAVVYALAAGPGDVEAAPEPTVVSSPVTSVVEVPPPSLEGVDIAVQRVLYASGKAEALRVDQLTELPPEVARILVHYGVTLTLPTGPTGGG